MNTRLLFPPFIFCAFIFLTLSSAPEANGQSQNNRDEAATRNANPSRTEVSREDVSSRGEARSRTPERNIQTRQTQNNRGAAGVPRVNPDRSNRPEENISRGERRPEPRTQSDHTQNRDGSRVRNPIPPRQDEADDHTATGSKKYKPGPRRTIIYNPKSQSVAICRSGREWLDIPKEYFPTPGSYRLWISGWSPWEQPSPTPHYDMVLYAPAGSRILYRPVFDDLHIYVLMTDPEQYGRVREMRIYDLHSGRYIRTERNWRYPQ